MCVGKRKKDALESARARHGVLCLSLAQQSRACSRLVTTTYTPSSRGEMAYTGGRSAAGRSAAFDELFRRPQQPGQQPQYTSQQQQQQQHQPRPPPLQYDYGYGQPSATSANPAPAAAARRHPSSSSSSYQSGAGDQHVPLYSKNRSSYYPLEPHSGASYPQPHHGSNTARSHATYQPQAQPGMHQSSPEASQGSWQGNYPDAAPDAYQPQANAFSSPRSSYASTMSSTPSSGSVNSQFSRPTYSSATTHSYSQQQQQYQSDHLGGALASPGGPFAGPPSAASPVPTISSLPPGPPRLPEMQREEFFGFDSARIAGDGSGMGELGFNGQHGSASYGSQGQKRQGSPGSVYEYGSYEDGDSQQSHPSSGELVGFFPSLRLSDARLNRHSLSRWGVLWRLRPALKAKLSRQRPKLDLRRIRPSTVGADTSFIQLRVECASPILFQRQRFAIGLDHFDQSSTVIRVDARLTDTTKSDVVRPGPPCVLVLGRRTARHA